METYGERLKHLRKELGLAQDAFAESIGMTKSGISGIERGANNLTGQVVNAICREYGVSEKWLRDGEGEMFVPVTRNEKIARFAGELMKEETPEFRRQIVEILADLNDEQWDALADFAEKLAGIKK